MEFPLGFYEKKEITVRILAAGAVCCRLCDNIKLSVTNTFLLLNAAFCLLTLEIVQHTMHEMRINHGPTCFRVLNNRIAFISSEVCEML